MPHIIALFGSGVLGGNTDRLLTEAIRGAESTGCSVERFDIARLTIHPCIQSYNCMIENRCMIEDDAQPILDKLAKCDGVIIATPIMTYGIPGSLKCLMDRCQPYYMAQKRGKPFVSEKQAENRRTLFISISGMKTPDVFDGAKLTVKAFCHIISAKYTLELLQNDMDTIRKVENKPGLCETAFTRGKELGESLTHAADK